MTFLRDHQELDFLKYTTTVEMTPPSCIIETSARLYTKPKTSLCLPNNIHPAYMNTPEIYLPNNWAIRLSMLECTPT